MLTQQPGGAVKAGQSHAAGDHQRRHPAEREGEDLRRWVFQPSGLASPLSVRMRTRAVEIEATFDALTGEIVRERIDFLDQKP